MKKKKKMGKERPFGYTDKPHRAAAEAIKQKLATLRTNYSAYIK
jgi:hypothetical protein